MSDEHAAGTREQTEPKPTDHGTATAHGGDHGLDDHGHRDEALGPLDVAAWGAGVLGVGIALVIAIAFAMATSGVG